MSQALGVPLTSPVPQWSYPFLAAAFLSGGIGLTSSFFVYQVRSTKFSKDLKTEAAFGLASSLLLGLGSFFMLLYAGVYV